MYENLQLIVVAVVFQAVADTDQTPLQLHISSTNINSDGNLSYIVGFLQVHSPPGGSAEIGEST